MAKKKCFHASSILQETMSHDCSGLFDTVSERLCQHERFSSGTDYGLEIFVAVLLQQLFPTVAKQSGRFTQVALKCFIMMMSHTTNLLMLMPKYCTDSQLQFSDKNYCQ